MVRKDITVATVACRVSPESTRIPDAMNQVLQRPNSYGSPVELEELFILKRTNAQRCPFTFASMWLGAALADRRRVAPVTTCRAKDDILDVRSIGDHRWSRKVGLASNSSRLPSICEFAGFLIFSEDVSRSLTFAEDLIKSPYSPTTRREPLRTISSNTLGLTT
jgi:hypothetical protein